MSFNQRPRSLEEVCHLITDGSHFSPAPQAEGFPIVTAKDIPNGRINLDTCTRISRVDWETLKKQNCAPIPGDVLLSKDGTIGRVVFYESDFGVVVLSSIAILRPNNSIDSNYLAQVLRFDAFRRQLLVLESGSALRRIVIRDIKRLEFCFPEQKTEQAKIAVILSTVDRAIEQTEALIAKQQRIKTGLMQNLLTRGIDEHGNLRSEQTHPFKDSPLGRIPAEWEVGNLEAVADFVTSGSRGWARYYAVDGAIFLRIGNLTRNHINLRLDDIIRVNPPQSSEGKRTSVSAGDLLISITADLGVIGVIPKGFEEAYVNQHIAMVRFVRAKVNPRFIGWFLSSRRGQTQFQKLNESGAKAGLNLPTVRRLLVPMMELSEQTRIAEILDSNTNKTSSYHSRLTKLRSLKTALMQDLLTGKRRVMPLLDPEPAH